MDYCYFLIRIFYYGCVYNNPANELAGLSKAYTLFDLRYRA